MCGIIGYIGNKKALPILLDGLKRMEYRGYDSAGIAIHNGDKIKTHKAVGKITNLEKSIGEEKFNGELGIAHTRWATHGKPSIENAHPHSSCTGDLHIVHNGIIENYQVLKKQLIKKGHTFKSETDSEVVAHLIEEMYVGDLSEAVRKAVKLIKGAYGLAVVHKDDSQKLVIARSGSPLLLGIGDDETIVASDAAAIIRHTKKVIYLDEGDIAEITNDGIKFFNSDSKEISKDIKSIEWDIEQAEKQGYDHFMLKEIEEQLDTIQDSVRGRIILEEGKVKLGGLDDVLGRIREVDRVIIVACGTAMHAGLLGKMMLEEYAGIPVQVECASEFRYGKPILNSKTAVIALSQSGETADTLAAVREAKEKGALTLGIVNTVGSTIARETDAGVYNHIGPEISVASTKAFTSQISILVLFTILFGRQRRMSWATAKRIIEEMDQLPQKIKSILDQKEKIKAIAEKYKDYKDFAFLGRKYNNPIAFEGALKLKELSYIHAEGFASGEMKHGPIALIDENFPSLFIAPKDSVFEKNISNIEEIKSRSGKIIIISSEGEDLSNLSDDCIYIPKTLEVLTPILSVVPLQLFSYYVTVTKGLDVDRPRNLAKSVTVE